MVFPFGKVIAPPPAPVPSPPHAPARPPRCPSAALRRCSPIYHTFLCAVAALLNIGAAEHREGGPISPTQDPSIVYDEFTLPNRSEPPGGDEDGMKEADETSTWLMGGEPGRLAAHADTDDPQTKEQK